MSSEESIKRIVPVVKVPYGLVQSVKPASTILYAKLLVLNRNFKTITTSRETLAQYQHCGVDYISKQISELSSLGWVIVEYNHIGGKTTWQIFPLMRNKKPYLAIPYQILNDVQQGAINYREALLCSLIYDDAFKHGQRQSNLSNQNIALTLNISKSSVIRNLKELYQKDYVFYLKDDEHQRVLELNLDYQSEKEVSEFFNELNED